MKNFIFSLLCFVSATAFAQDTRLKDRLTAMNQSTRTFYNVDGFTITRQGYRGELTEKGLRKPLREYDVKFGSLAKDTGLPLNNLYATSSQPAEGGLTQNSSYYFVEKDGNVTVVWFGSINKTDKAFEREFVQLVVNNQVPPESFTSMTMGDVNFGGRVLKLGDPCYWTNINTVQCPYQGEMNWSVHKDSLDAVQTVGYQLQMTKAKKSIKVLSEEAVDIVFEEVPVKATKVVYDLTGLVGLAAGTSGGKTLTVYYVAGPVRGNYISCVLSYWNNDDINPASGLPKLLEQVMRVK